ncbi:tetratricopeptide repeat protein [Pedobacter ginsengisoli]|uniref:tetratricopeptide repeat protein n=1 Tax=Pedobacter ginsengisoli TaxID=363852 RepID=UPI00254FBF2F|nr:tetratricopeptide repeat protein [Pedobacter ginsengisoli]
MKFKLTFLIFLVALTAHAQTNLNIGWEFFLKNDHTNARSFFNKQTLNPATADEALVALAMIGQVDRPDAEGFSYLNKLAGTSKNPTPYLIALWSDPANYSGRIKSAEQLEFYRKLSTRKDVDGALNAMAFSLLGAHYQQLKQFKEADSYFANLGELENWLITGEYENISTSGFDKQYDVIAHPETNYVFTGKMNRKFSWRTVPHIRHDRWFDFTYYNAYHNAIQFAQTFLNVPEEVNAQIRVGVSGSVKVWVNDQLLISEAEERNNDLDSYISNVKLSKGYNRILVQVGESYAGRSNFMVRVTDVNGRPLPQLTTSSEPKPYTKAGASVAALVKSPGFQYFEDGLKGQSGTYFSQLMLAKLYLHQGNIFEARLLLEQLKSKFPESTYLNLLLINLFNKADNRTGIETLNEEIKQHDPESLLALELKYNEHLSQNDDVKASEVLAKLEKIYGEDESVLLKKLNILVKQKKEPEVMELVERVYPKFNNIPKIVELKYLIESQFRNNPDAMAVLQKYIDTNDDYASAKYVAKLYIEKGQTDKGIAIYRKEIEGDPIGYAIYTDLAAIYTNLQKYDEAEKLYKQSLEIDPNNAGVYEELGQLYKLAKAKEKSITAYETALRISPNNYEAIKSLRELQGKKYVFDYFVQPDIKDLIAKAPSKSDYPDDHVVMLNNEVQKVVYKDGGSEEKHFITAKILTQTGLENMKEYSIGYNNDQNLYIEVAEVIKANGSKVPAETDQNQLVFTNLEVGDFVNIRYKMENFHIGAMSSHFWDTFYFSDGLPHANIKYSLLVHKEKIFKHLFSQQEIKPEKTVRDEFDLYVWQKTRQPSLRYEDKMPAMDDVANVLYISTIPDWNFISHWYDNIASAKARSSYEIRKVVNDLFAGKQSLSQLEKVKMIYKYITTNIAYSSVGFRQSGIVPQNPSAVINTRIGDCKDVSTLFVAMCKEADINANLALANTRDRGQNTLLLPSMEFNHCIAKASIDNKDYWVELTSGTLPFNTFGNSFLGSNVLEIGKPESKLAKFSPAERGRNIMGYNTFVKLEEKDMVISEKNWNTGSVSSFLRTEFSDLSSSDQVKKMKEQLAGSYPENEVSILKFTNLDPKKNFSDTVGTESAYKLLNVSKTVAGMSIFSLPWSGKAYATNLKMVTQRYFGIDLVQLFGVDECNQELLLELPAGKKIVEAVKTVKLSNEFADYQLQTSESNGKLVLKRSFVMKKDFVPLDKVDQFKVFYKEMCDIDDQQIAMK